MKFNTLKNQVIISALLAAPSYTLLFLIRGYNFSEMTGYAHITYSLVVFVILLCLFGLHTAKSNRLKNYFSWKERVYPRLAAEIGSTLVFTPLIVTFFVYILYEVFWGMELWIPGLIEYNLFAFCFSLLIGGFVNLDTIIDEWEKSLIKNEVLEKENIKAKLDSLQAKVSPHFLFNNFNALNSLINDNPTLAGRYLEKLSEVYRYILNQKNEELVSLSDEIQFIRDYIFLLGIRFDNKLKCAIEIDGCGNNKIPPATLQILVENAVKHNEISSRKPLSITITAIEGSYLKISNSLQPKNNNTRGTGFGMANIRERYRYLTDRPVKVNRNPDTFEVEIPMISL